MIEALSRTDNQAINERLRAVRASANTSRMSFHRALLCLLLPALASAGPATAPAAPPPSAATARFDDARWVGYFGSQYALYLAVRDPRHLPGPHLSSALAKTEDQMIAGYKPDEALARAAKAHVLERPLDLVERGFAVGVTHENGATRILAVATRTPAADALIAWAKASYTAGVSAVAQTQVSGHPALELRNAGKTELVFAVDGDAVLMADRPEELVAAFRTKESGMLSLAGSRTYGRLRPKVKPDAVALAVITPGPELAALIKREAAPPGTAELIELAMTTVDGYMATLSGDAHGQALDLYFSLNAMSPGYAQLHLADRARFYGSHTLALAGVAPGDAGGFLTGLQPTFDTRQAPASEQQGWNVFKGQLQVLTGLSFDAEIVPWLGPEAAVVLRATGEQPELALLLTTTDPKASQASLEKAVRHITISQNRTFTTTAVGPVSAQVAQVIPGNPVTPALAVTQGTVVLSSAPGLLAAMASYPLKAAQAEPHQRILAALSDRAVFMVGWITAALEQRVARMTGGPDAKPLPDGLEAIGVGLAMPEPDLVHGVISLSTH